MQKSRVDEMDLVFGDRVTTLLKLADEHRESSYSHDKKQFIERDDIGLLVAKGANFKDPYRQTSGIWTMELTYLGRTFIYAGVREPEIPLHLVPKVH